MGVGVGIGQGVGVGVTLEVLHQSFPLDGAKRELSHKGKCIALYVSAIVVSNYSYLKVNFLKPRKFTSRYR